MVKQQQQATDTKVKQELAKLTDHDKGMLKDHLNTLEASMNRPSVKFVVDDDGKLVIDTPKGSTLAWVGVANTTGCTGQDAGLKLINQVMGLLGSSSTSDANALAEWMNGIAPNDPVEGMLATQMVASHYMAMAFARRAIHNDHTTAIDANTKRMTKLMAAFSKHLETLQKYRNKGQQTIQVQHQHVQVNNGGQAIVGNVSHGEGG